MTDHKPIQIQDINSDPKICLVFKNHEMIRITPEGFYVRGKKVEQGPGEAQEVYEAFTEFLAKANQ